MRAALKNLVRAILPASLVRAISDRRRRKVLARFDGLSSQEIFTKIYAEGVWGQSDNPDDPYVSGTGSRDSAVVARYVEGVTALVSALPQKLDAVDLGCGDFTVGSQLRSSFGNYVACDIVETVIAFNRERYRDLDVDFRRIDLAHDALPDGEVAIVRQVLQHLSNAEVAAALANIAGKFRYLLATEHVPHGDFVPNRDKPTGPGIRMDSGSGLVLTEPPFALRPLEQQLVCEVPSDGGIIRTMWYRLRA